MQKKKNYKYNIKLYIFSVLQHKLNMVWFR